LTEPSAGSDASGTQTRAVFDGQWILNGSKSLITNAHYADVCVAMAVTDAAAGNRGISAFVMENHSKRFWSEEFLASDIVLSSRQQPNFS